ncbi:MAG: LuxR C-terminal-related transcriptional regulator [Oscillospiraceae bacterium]|nr:LuxR C-terminal-related transcriptional regulator [Oscillospiraceae bacterium]
MYRIYPTLLCDVYLDIQLAGAYEKLGKRDAAVSHLKRALEAAMPDSLFLPFAENCNYFIEPLRDLAEGLWNDPIEKIIALYLQNRLEKREHLPVPETLLSLDALSERELSVARLAAAGMRNKEIAAELYLSESYVKTCLGRVFQKLRITDKKDKRSLLVQLLDTEEEEEGCVGSR